MKNPILMRYGKYSGRSFSWISQNDKDHFLQIPNLFWNKLSFEERDSYKLIKKIILNKRAKQEFQKYLPDIITLIKKQTPREEIRQFVREKQDISERDLDNLLKDAKGLITEECERENALLIDLHCLRYEDIYATSWDKTCTDVPDRFRKAALADAKLTAIEALFAKEKVLGMHTKSFKLKLNDYFQHKRVIETPTLNFTDITTAELAELVGLIEEACIQDVRLVGSAYEEDTVEDVEHTEVDKEIDFPIQQAKETDELGKKKEKEKEIEKIINLDGVKEKINKTLEEQIKALYKKKTV